MERLVKVATPATVEAVSVPPSVPVPVASAAVTTVPAVVTAFPNTSASRTAGCTAKATPLWADGDGCVWIWSVAAAPATPVALKVSGLPVSPAEVAVTVFAPTTGPRVQAVSVAMPAALVAIGVVGRMFPPPPVTAKATDTPATGLPLMSVTLTDGGAAAGWPAVSVCVVAELARSVVAAADVPVAWKVTENPDELAMRELPPATVPSVQRVAARPLTSVVADVGLVVPAPVAIAKVTLRPGTPLPLPSSRRTTNDSGTALPAAAVWLSPEALISEAGAAGNAVIVKATGDPLSPAAVAVAPCGPAAAPSVRRVAAVPTVPVVLDAGLTVPPPVGAQATTPPLTALPYRSVILTTRDSGSAAPTSADCPSPRATKTVSAGAASAVASKFWISAPPEVAPTTIACTRCAPAVVPSNQRVPVRPSALVSPVSGTASPPPRTGEKTTLIPSTGRDSESMTRTVSESGRVVATTAVWPLPATVAIAAGRPSLGSVRSSLLQVTAAAARASGQASARNLKGKRRNSGIEDLGMAARATQMGHSPCPIWGGYGIAKVQLPQALGKKEEGAGTARIAVPRHPPVENFGRSNQGTWTDTPKFQSLSV